MTDLPPREAELGQRKVLEAVAQLRREGWTVTIAPKPDTVPELDGYRPDYIARRNDEIVVGEVKTRSRVDLNDLQKLASRVRRLGNARLDIVWLGKVDIFPSATEIAELVERANRVAAVDRAAALLLAWAGLSGAVESLDLSTLGGSETAKSVRQRIAEMSSLGIISDSQYFRLDDLAKTRNRIAHGATESPSAEGVAYVSAVALAFAANEYFSIEFLTEWFFEHYKDPAEGVPYESREGGYFYYAGGPYEADEVLREEFASMPPEDIADAVAQIQELGAEWVRVEDY